MQSWFIIHYGFFGTIFNLIHQIENDPTDYVEFNGSNSQAGADPGFPNRGGTKDYVHASHITSVKPEVRYGRGSGPAEGLRKL